MKKKILFMLVTGVLSGMVLTGCNNKEEDKDTQNKNNVSDTTLTVTVTKAPEPTRETEPTPTTKPTPTPTPAVVPQPTILPGEQVINQDDKVTIITDSTPIIYETSDASWLLNAPDDAIVTVVYTCTDESHAGWGILGWGATSDNVWDDGISYTAAENPASEVTAVCTVKELKESMNIKENSTVSYMSLSTWNGGMLISISVVEKGAVQADGEQPVTGDIIIAEDMTSAYETSDASWLINAADDAVITLVYTCTEAANGGWGVLGWGATVDDTWHDGISYNAADDAVSEVTVTFTAKELKEKLGITEGANVSYMSLSTWNGGKIISLSISGE